MFKLELRLGTLLFNNFKVKPICAIRFNSNQPHSPLRSRKPKSKNPTVQYYVDRCSMRVMGGRGGDGCISFLSDWANEYGGPDGGDGGNGGHVVFSSTVNTTNLNHCKVVVDAEHGEKGSNKDRHGKSASHTIIKVPIGTVIKNINEQIIADLDEEGKMFLAARGGSGGRGNKFFTTDIEQAPEIAEFGAHGENHTYMLEVKSMAHIGLIGFPNAGKSTLLQAITRARSKIAPYPFTTLHPHIGMVQYEDLEQIAVADLPGLIPGSHQNRGLGIKFLQHAERCCCLIYMIDMSIAEPWLQLESLQYELSQFSEELATRPKLVIANKIDLPEAECNLPLLEDHCKDFDIIPISAKVGINISHLLKIIREIYDARPK